MTSSKCVSLIALAIALKGTLLLELMITLEIAS